jgi:uncharacterized protein (TIGR02246 family)
MPDAQADEAVAATMKAINRAWLNGRPDELVPLFHPDVIMVFPGFAGRTAGRESVIAGFADFCSNAAVHEFHESDFQTDVVGDTAVAAFRYDMVYERSGEKYRATGRDLWVFGRDTGNWIAD